MAHENFEENVFINCPFDDDFAPLLKAMLFCIVYFGLTPRLATERQNAGEARLQKIEELIYESKYSIHDLSRCKARDEGEYYRLNMPFELGLDFGCKKYGGEPYTTKSILVLEETPNSYDISLSDLSGSDVAAHEGRYGTIIRKVRNWLVTNGIQSTDGAAKITSEYEDFLEWHYETLEERGFSEDDILDYSTTELLDFMVEWVIIGKPI